MEAKTRKKVTEKWQYEYDFVSFTEVSSDPKEIHKTIFTCGQDGDCKEEAKHPAIEALTGYLNKRGQNGWELVQLFPHERGILYLFKKKIG